MSIYNTIFNRKINTAYILSSLTTKKKQTCASYTTQNNKCNSLLNNLDIDRIFTDRSQKSTSVRIRERSQTTEVSVNVCWNVKLWERNRSSISASECRKLSVHIWHYVHFKQTLCISITTSKTKSVCKYAVVAAAALTKRNQSEFLYKFFVKHSYANFRTKFNVINKEFVQN